MLISVDTTEIDEEQLILKVKLFKDFDDSKPIEIEIPIKTLEDGLFEWEAFDCTKWCPMHGTGYCTYKINHICDGILDHSIEEEYWYFDVSIDDAKALYATLISALDKESGIVKKKIFKRCQTLE